MSWVEERKESCTPHLDHRNYVETWAEILGTSKLCTTRKLCNFFFFHKQTKKRRRWKKNHTAYFQVKKKVFEPTTMTYRAYIRCTISITSGVYLRFFCLCSRHEQSENRFNMTMLLCCGKIDDREIELSMLATWSSKLFNFLRFTWFWFIKRH